MGDITVEQKLQLIHQIRSEYNRNQNDIRSREQILYGRTGINSYHSNYEEITNNKPTSIKARILIAISVLVIIVILDIRQESMLGITTSKIFSEIARDMEIEIEANDIINELTKSN